MRLVLDAWLERRAPIIRVYDADNGEIVLEWDQTRIQRLMENADICMEDVNNPALSCSERLGLLQQVK